MTFIQTFEIIFLIISFVSAYHWDSTKVGWEKDFDQQYEAYPIICAGETPQKNFVNTNVSACPCVPLNNSLVCPDTSLTNEYLWFRGLEREGFETLTWNHHDKLDRFSDRVAFISLLLQISPWSSGGRQQNSSLKISMDDFLDVDIDMTMDHYLSPKRYVIWIDKHWIEYFTFTLRWQYGPAPLQNQTFASSNLFIYDLTFFI